MLSTLSNHVHPFGKSAWKRAGAPPSLARHPRLRVRLGAPPAIAAIAADASDRHGPLSSDRHGPLSDRGPEAALVLAWNAAKNRSLFAAQCFAEAVLDAYSRGQTVDDLEVCLCACVRVCV